MGIIVKNEAVPVLLKKVDQARLEQVHLQTRLEGQVQQRELELLQAVKKVDVLAKQLKQSVDESNALKKRVKDLEAQLQTELQQKTQLLELLKQYRAQEHVGNGKEKSCNALKDGIQKQLDAANARIEVLNTQLVSEREAARRRESIKDLKGAKLCLENKIQGLEDLHVLTIAFSTITGLSSGGLVWGLVGLGTGLTILIMPGVGLEKKSETKNKLAHVNKSLAKFPDEEKEKIKIHDPYTEIKQLVRQ
jgi:hypothetical protein